MCIKCKKKKRNKTDRKREWRCVCECIRLGDTTDRGEERRDREHLQTPQVKTIQIKSFLSSLCPHQKRVTIVHPRVQLWSVRPVVLQPLSCTLLCEWMLSQSCSLQTAAYSHTQHCPRGQGKTQLKRKSPFFFFLHRFSQHHVANCFRSLSKNKCLWKRWKQSPEAALLSAFDRNNLAFLSLLKVASWKKQPVWQHCAGRQSHDTRCWRLHTTQDMHAGGSTHRENSAYEVEIPPGQCKSGLKKLYINNTFAAVITRYKRLWLFLLTFINVHDFGLSISLNTALT